MISALFAFLSLLNFLRSSPGSGLIFPFLLTKVLHNLLKISLLWFLPSWHLFLACQKTLQENPAFRCTVSNINMYVPRGLNSGPGHPAPPDSSGRTVVVPNSSGRVSLCPSFPFFSFLFWLSGVTPRDARHTIQAPGRRLARLLATFTKGMRSTLVHLARSAWKGMSCSQRPDLWSKDKKEKKCWNDLTPPLPPQVLTLQLFLIWPKLSKRIPPSEHPRGHARSSRIL
jgi:hypothetical protein